MSRRSEFYYLSESWIMANPVGDEGSILQHVVKLAAALRAKEWTEALRLALDILQHVTEPIDVGPQPMFSSIGRESLADALEAVGTAKGAPAAAIPWGQLIPLILQALQLIFGPK
jgi:hypothetical protein